MIRKQTIFVDHQENELEVFATNENTVRIFIKQFGSQQPNDWAFYDIDVADLDSLIDELISAKEELIS